MAIERDTVAEAARATLKKEMVEIRQDIRQISGDDLQKIMNDALAKAEIVIATRDLSRDLKESTNAHGQEDGANILILSLAVENIAHVTNDPACIDRLEQDYTTLFI